MQEIKYTNFKGVDDIMANLFGEDQVLQRAMRRSTLFKFWSKVVGKPFDEKSKPYGMMNGTTMIIACESAVVVQELTMRKRKIIKELAPYVKGLNIELKDMMFDVKRWQGN